MRVCRHGLLEIVQVSFVALFSWMLLLEFRSLIIEWATRTYPGVLPRICWLWIIWVTASACVWTIVDVLIGSIPDCQCALAPELSTPPPPPPPIRPAQLRVRRR